MELASKRRTADGSYSKEFHMPAVLGVALAGAFGALARYQLDVYLTAQWGSRFPWATFAINISGAFLLGLIFSVMTGRLDSPQWLRSTIMTGFLGAYTTFSTLTLETAQLMEEGRLGLAFLNSAGSLVCGMLAVFAGILLGDVFD
jgi:CrcB protein